MVTPVLAAQSALLNDYLADVQFFWRVYNGCRLDIDSARKKVGSAAMPETDIRSDVRTAIKLGIFRAWAYRFLVDTGANPASYFSKQRDRDKDFERLRAEFPNYDQYLPSSALTEDEIFEASREEVRRIFNGRGTDAHQTRLWRGGEMRHGVARPIRVESEVAKEFETTTSVLPSVNNAAFTLPSNDVFGPVILSVASHFITVFGLIPTTYWVFEKMFCPGEYSTLLRIFGDADTIADPARFKAMQVDIARKLKSMDDELVVFQSRADLRNYYEHIEEVAS